jgi:hypothetical protein
VRLYWDAAMGDSDEDRALVDQAIAIRELS